jgi:riboflavin kinase/FMN adenylyltransferase
VRSAIRAGEVELAGRLLTHCYRIRGMVTHGSARGGLLGFPTANLEGIDTLVPAHGIYAGRAHIQQRAHWSAIHIGPNPTFGDHVPKVEVHVLDFEDSLYGQVLEVDFARRLRDVATFESGAHLIAQLQRDVEAVRAVARQCS